MMGSMLTAPARVSLDFNTLRFLLVENVSLCSARFKGARLANDNTTLLPFNHFVNPFETNFSMNLPNVPFSQQISGTI